jgi:hypothetical protein
MVMHAFEPWIKHQSQHIMTLSLVKCMQKRKLKVKEPPKFVVSLELGVLLIQYQTHPL